MEDARYKILLIEDDEVDQMVFMRMVEDKELSYDCTIAGYVSMAQRILDSERFDIIVADYLLGDGTAFDILDSVKNTPTIFVTRAGDEEVAVKAWRAGAYDYLIKDHERNYLKTVPITIENAIKHKRTEERLRLLSHAILNTDDSVYITDLGDKITFVNRAFCETYGYAEEEIIGKDCNILWQGSSPGTETRDTWQAVRGWEVGVFQRRKDNSRFPVSLSRSYVKDENGNEVALVAVARDISERMQIENKLRGANKELEKQNRLKTELAVAVSKEVEAPLADLKDILSNARTGTLGEISPKLQENLESAAKDVDIVMRAIINFRDVSNINAAELNLESAEVVM